MSNKLRTLAAFGFTKKVIRNDGGGEKEIEVKLPEEILEEAAVKKEVCPFCDDRFVNTQGLSVHIKCVHPASSRKDSTVLDVNSNKVCDETNSSLDPIATNETSRKDNDLEKVTNEEDVEVIGVKDDKRKGAEKRKMYEAGYKMEVIYDIESGLSKTEAAEKYKLSLSLVSKWVKNKKIICSQCVSGNLKLKKIRPSNVKHSALFVRLYQAGVYKKQEPELIFPHR